jgi:hypothetical protein
VYAAESEKGLLWATSDPAEMDFENPIFNGGWREAPSSIHDPEMRVTSFTKVKNNDSVSRECGKNC